MRGNGFERDKIGGDYVSGNFFPALGLQPVLGRLIGPDDDHMGLGNPVAVLSCYQQPLPGNPDVLGKTLYVEDVPVTIIGVAPPEFFGSQVGSAQDLWLPLGMEPILRKPNSYENSASWRWLTLVGCEARRDPEPGERGDGGSLPADH